MNKIGVYAYCGFNVSAEERFQAIKDSGFSVVGVQGSGDFNGGNGISDYQQSKYVRENSLQASYAHAPSRQAPYLANKYYGAKEAVKNHKLWAKNASEQGIKILVIHLPQVTSVVIDNVAEIASFCTTQGIKLAVENLSGATPFDELFGAVKDVYFCYDTCHALMFGDSDGKMAERYADRLVCTHISDGDGVSDCHWVAGDGKYDFITLAKRLKSVKYSGDYISEALESPKYTDISEFLKLSKSRLEALFH